MMVKLMNGHLVEFHTHAYVPPFIGLIPQVSSLSKETSIPYGTNEVSYFDGTTLSSGRLIVT